VLGLPSWRLHREYRRRSTPPVTPPRYAPSGMDVTPDRRGLRSVSVLVAGRLGRRHKVLELCGRSQAEGPELDGSGPSVAAPKLIGVLIA
jgi:hypothetical protein